MHTTLRPTRCEHRKSTHKNNATSKGIAYRSRTIIQAKLEMTSSGDADEMEADAVANQIVEGGKISRSISNNSNGGGIVAPKRLENLLAQKQSGGHEMPDGLRRMMENGFDRDFSQVRLHTDSESADMSSSINAKAFTHGNDIYFNRGQYSPETQQGQHLIAHELTHVAQNNGKVARREEKNLTLAPMLPVSNMENYNRKRKAELEFDLISCKRKCEWLNDAILEQEKTDNFASNLIAWFKNEDYDTDQNRKEINKIKDHLSVIGKQLKSKQYRKEFKNDQEYFEHIASNIKEESAKLYLIQGALEARRNTNIEFAEFGHKVAVVTKDLSFAVVQIYISKGDIKKDIITGAIFGAVDALAIEAGEKLWGVSDEIEWTNVIEGAVIGGVSGGISNKIGNFAKVTQRLKGWGKSDAIKIGGFVDKIKAKIAKSPQRSKGWGKSDAIKIGGFVDKRKAKIAKITQRLKGWGKSAAIKIGGFVDKRKAKIAKITQRLKGWGKSAAIKIGGFVDKIKAKIAKITQRLKSWGKSAAIKIGDFVDKIKAKITKTPQRSKGWEKNDAIKIGDFVDKIKAKIVRFIYSREKYFSDKTKFEWFVEATIGSLTSLFINYLWQKTKEKKEEAIKTIERSYTEAIYQLSKKTEDIILSDMHFFK